MALRGSPLALTPSVFFLGAPSCPIAGDRGVARVSCRKQNVHPQFHTRAKVYCNGELVMTTGGTQPEYVVDVWSGNHPYFQGKGTAFLHDADKVDKFNVRYGSLSDFGSVPVLTIGEAVFERKKKPKGKGTK
eukprot:c21712_g1_i1 orf=430-825(+)